MAAPLWGRETLACSCALQESQEHSYWPLRAAIANEEAKRGPGREIGGGGGTRRRYFIALFARCARFELLYRLCECLMGTLQPGWQDCYRHRAAVHCLHIPCGQARSQAKPPSMRPRTVGTGFHTNARIFWLARPPHKRVLHTQAGHNTLPQVSHYRPARSTQQSSTGQHKSSYIRVTTVIHTETQRHISITVSHTESSSSVTRHC